MLVYETNAFNTQRMLIKKNAAKKKILRQKELNEFVWRDELQKEASIKQPSFLYLNF